MSLFATPEIKRPKRKLTDSPEIMAIMEKCAGCEKDIDDNDFLRCILCLTTYHSHQKCAPKGLFNNKNQCMLPPWMMNTFVCSKECAMGGISVNPLFVALQTELSILKDQVAEQAIQQRKTICEVLDESEERQNRKNNLILFNVEESQDDDGKIRQENDQEAVKTVFGKIGVEEVTFNNCIRLGKRSEKSRPIRIHVDSIEKKKDILRNAKRLKTDRNFPGPPPIFIAADLTPIQREKRRDLIMEFKKRKEKNENVRIDWKLNRIVANFH